MTKEQMLSAIYEKIANKELTFGCKIRWNSDTWNCVREDNDGLILERDWASDWIHTVHIDFWENDFRTIGHPVMIGDCIAYLDDVYEEKYWAPPPSPEVADKMRKTILDMLMYWEFTRKPIDDQSTDCITYIHSLIK